ncbi:nucleoside-diphosphate sugar epimerase/dehydratase [Larkinella ripae]
MRAIYRISLTNRFASRYFILLTDAILAVASFAVAFGLRFNFDFATIDGPQFLTGLLLTISIRLGCFLFIGTHQGIIRHTSLEDVVPLVYAVTLSALSIALVSWLLAQGDTTFNVPFSIILIDYFCCLVLLSLSRFGIKTVYWHLSSTGYDSRERVLIYGAGETGLVTRKALVQNSTHRYQVLAFVDDDPAKIDKVIEGIRVISREQAYHRFIRNQTYKPQVILATEGLNPAKRAVLVDFFLQHQVPIKTIPSVGQWMDGQLTALQLQDVSIEELLEREPIHLANEALGDHLNGQVIMVTGAAGSIGSELVAQVLHYHPQTVVLVDQAESALFELEHQLRRQHKTALSHIQLVVKIADVSDEIRMGHIFRATRPTLIFHAAAYKHVPLMEAHPYEAVRVNVLGTKVVADLAVEYGVETFVLISTDKAVNPTNVMGATKRLAEMYVQGLTPTDPLLRQTRFVVTRFGNVLGSNGSVVTVFRQQIRSGGPVTVTHPDVIRYFMTIPEACQLVLEAGVMGQGGEVFVFDMGRPLRIVDLARKMIHLSRSAAGPDIRILFTGLRPGEKLYEELLHKAERTLPTHHPKILKARVLAPPGDEIQRAVEHLRQLLPEDNDRALVATIKRLIPEFISNNPVYTTLDF